MPVLCTEPKFIVILWELRPAPHGVKDSSGMGNAQCPCSMKYLFKDIRSALTTSLPLLCVYIKNQFWKLSDRYKCAQPIGDVWRCLE